MGPFHLVFDRAMWNIEERREMQTRSWWGNPKQRDHLEDPVVDGKHITIGLKNRMQCMDWINLAHNRDMR